MDLGGVLNPTRLTAVIVLILLLLIVFFAFFPSASPDGTGFNAYVNEQGLLVTADGAIITSKTLWDWLDLLVGGLIVGGVLAMGGYFLNRSARENELRIAEDNRNQAALQAYYHEMAELILTHELKSDTTNGKEARAIARARTLATFRGLDGERKGLLLRFLSESNLTNQGTGLHIELRESDLSRAVLTRIDLKGADLEEANLSQVQSVRIDLSSTVLEKADLRRAVLDKAKLDKANLGRADLRESSLRFARLQGAWLRYAELGGADMEGANLTGASLIGARYDRHTQWPDGFDPLVAGAVPEED